MLHFTYFFCVFTFAVFMNVLKVDKWIGIQIAGSAYGANCIHTSLIICFKNNQARFFFVGIVTLNTCRYYL